MIPECKCPRCGWAGLFVDSVEKTEWNTYGEAFGSPAWKLETTYFCPLCNTEVDLDTETEAETEDERKEERE